MEPFRYEHITPPKSVDWRTKGVVGPIKDQHVNGSACGCCWTFATTGVAECIIAMATGKVIALSEQQLIDCDRAGERSAWHLYACQPFFRVQIFLHLKLHAILISSGWLPYCKFSIFRRTGPCGTH